MKRLRHPIRAIREPFGTAGLVVACVALIAALGGTALAAAKLNSTQKKEVEKIAKKYAGKPGAPGATGPAGAQGAAGAAGKDGTNGTNGKDGTNGTNGTNGSPGKSVKATDIPPETAKCEERGGTELEVEGSGSASEICNGKEGSPWTAGGTLPPGATETGAWSFTASSANADKILASVSFPILLAKPLTSAHVHFQGLPTEETFEEVCPSGAFGSALPTAKPGELCVYNQLENEPKALFNATFSGISSLIGIDPEAKGAGRAGAILRFTFTGSAGEAAQGFGSWAVTGCSESLQVGDPNKCP